MDSKPKTRADLDAAFAHTFGGDACEHRGGLGLHASCHTSALLQVWYRDGLLLLRCGLCNSAVATIAVADPLPSVTLQ